MVGGVSVARGPCRSRQVPPKLPKVPLQLLAREVAAMHQVVLPHLVVTVKVAKVQSRKVLVEHTLLVVAVQVERHPGTLPPEDSASSFASAEIAVATDLSSAVDSAQGLAVEVLLRTGSEQLSLKNSFAELPVERCSSSRDPHAL